MRIVGHLLAERVLSAALAAAIGLVALFTYGSDLWAPPTPEERFDDPVSGGTDVALQELGFSLLGTRHFVVEDNDSSGLAWVNHFVEMGETGCDVDDLACVRNLFAGSSWVDDTSPDETAPDDVDSFLFAVDGCTGSAFRFPNETLSPPLGEIEVIDAWRVTVRCRYG